MRIIFFVENNHCGGMDTFFENVINYWPSEEDEIILVGNRDHPGLDNIREAVKRPCRIIGHSIPLNWQVSRNIFGWLPQQIRRVTQPFLRVLLFPLQVVMLRHFLKKLAGDRLLVVNGAYPGGESCRAAGIVWCSLGKDPCIHNIRNFAASPRFGFGWYENWVDRKVSASTRVFVGVSRACSESLRIRKTFRTLGNIRHIYNGTVLDTVQNNTTGSLRLILGIHDAPMCLMLGTYEPRKGHRFLFESFRYVFKELPQTHLVICGHGTPDEVDRVKKLQQNILPGTNIHLLGFLPNGTQLAAQADVLLIASQEWESFGWTAIEAMSQGVPVVSTNVGGLPEVIGEDGEAGYCVDPDDVHGYAQRIISLLRDPARRKIIGENGRGRAHTMFSVNRMASEYAALIKGSVRDNLEYNISGEKFPENAGLHNDYK